VLVLRGPTVYDVHVFFLIFVVHACMPLPFVLAESTRMCSAAPECRQTCGTRCVMKHPQGDSQKAQRMGRLS
jgi:hypothetical protein